MTQTVVLVLLDPKAYMDGGTLVRKVTESKVYVYLGYINNLLEQGLRRFRREHRMPL